MAGLFHQNSDVLFVSQHYFIVLVEFEMQYLQRSTKRMQITVKSLNKAETPRLRLFNDDDNIFRCGLERRHARLVRFSTLSVASVS